MADMNVGSLPAAEALDDDSLLVAEQQGEAVHFTGKLLKDYAKQGVDALVAAALEAAEKAEQAAQEAEEAAGKVQDVSADVEAAKEAAQAAENARAAADAARTAAEQAAALAAQNAAADVETRLQNYVTDAEQAKQDAQNAAETAAQEAVVAVGSDMAQYVSAAQSAQKAAEQARDEAQAIAGGDFLPTTGGTITGNTEFQKARMNYIDGYTTYDNVAEFSSNNGTNVGAIKITMPPDSTLMFNMDFRLYAYHEAWSLMFTGYINPGFGFFYQPNVAGTTSGTVNPRIRAGTNADGSYCFILGDIDSNWGGYLHCSVPRLSHAGRGSYSYTEDMSIELVTDISDITIDEEMVLNKTTPIPTAVNRTDAETIGGVKTFTDYQRRTYGQVTNNKDVAGAWFGTTAVGAIVILMPHVNMMFDMDVNLYSNTSIWNMTLSGYTYVPNGTNMNSAKATGVFTGVTPKVRTAFRSDGRRCFVLGDTDTNWGGYPHVSVPRLTAGGVGYDVSVAGMEILLVTDLSEYDVQLTLEFNNETPIDPGNLTAPVPIEKGGTNAASAEDARANLGAVGLTGNENISGEKRFKDHLALDNGKMWSIVSGSQYSNLAADAINYYNNGKQFGIDYVKGQFYNRGGTLTLPTVTDTLATLGDITAAVGDINTILDEINGEVV